MTVILTKCIDLSVGANIALTGVLVALINAAYPGIPGAAADGDRGRHRPLPRRLQRRDGLAGRHSADRRHARHAVDLPRPRLRRLRRHLHRRPPDEPGVHRHPARGVPWPAGRCRGSPSSSSRSLPSLLRVTPHRPRLLTPPAATRPPRSMPASTSAATQFIAFCISGLDLPASAATSGPRATPSPMSTLPAASSLRSSPPASSAASRSPAASARWPARSSARCSSAWSRTRCR